MNKARGDTCLHPFYAFALHLSAWSTCCICTGCKSLSNMDIILSDTELVQLCIIRVRWRTTDLKKKRSQNCTVFSHQHVLLASNSSSFPIKMIYWAVLTNLAPLFSELLSPPRTTQIVFFCETSLLRWQQHGLKWKAAGPECHVHYPFTDLTTL